jgi:hypothetical protein
MTRSRPEGASALSIVEDLFVTEAFLIKGRLANKFQRLTTMLEDSERTFLTIENAAMVSLRGTQIIHAPRVLVNRSEVIFAHELVDTASDESLRRLSSTVKDVRIRAFYSGAIQLEIAGQVESGAYEASHRSGREYFVIEKPVFRGLNLEASEPLKLLVDLDYAIVRKSKLAYIYDFS